MTLAVNFLAQKKKKKKKIATKLIFYQKKKKKKKKKMASKFNFDQIDLSDLLINIWSYAKDVVHGKNKYTCF